MFSPRYWIFFFIVITAFSYSAYRLNSATTITTSSNDPYQYRTLTLSNGLKALLIHTPNSEKAAAALSVDVGSGDDPQGREGLAHFLEHMLFLGTQPFPEAGEYQAFLSRHGGNFNAFTAYQQTTYFFDIDNQALEGALTRFSPFFISPTFEEQYVEREKNAVNAEYRAKIRDDFRRIYSAEKQAMNPKHPYSGFATGNLDTLADRENSTIRDELIEFYKQHYSANKMTLVISGNYPLSQLEAWTKHFFLDIPTQQTEPRPTPVPLFVPEQLPLDLNIEPVKEIRQLQFSFPMPESRSLFPAKPVEMLSHLLGHEGEGSLLAFLKQRGWAEGLSAGNALNTHHENLLTVRIELTRLGLMQQDRITQALLHYIDLIKAHPLPEYLLKEQQQLNELAFQFSEQSRLTDYVVLLSSNLLRYPTKEVIYGDYQLGNLNEQQWRPFLQALDGKNMLRTLIAPQVATDTVDPWYNTPIRIRPMNYQPQANFTEELTALHLPEANPFIPSNFELSHEPEQQYPRALINESGRQVWYFSDQEFKLPKARVIIQLTQDDIQNSAKSRLLAALYARAITENLNTFSYPATVAGLTYKLGASHRGLELGLGGYHDKLPQLLESILQTMQAFSISPDEFSRYQASLTRQLENTLKNKPYEHALNTLSQWLYLPSFSERELLQVLPTLTHADLMQFAVETMSHTNTNMLVHGNLSAKQALTLANLVEHYFPHQGANIPLPKVLAVPDGKFQHALHLQHSDKALVLYVQGQTTSDHERARFALLGQILSAPYYERLRTEEQLGYIVFASQYPQQTVPGLAFIVQAPEATPQHIERSNERFFADFEPQLAAISDEEFESFKQGLITLLTEKPKNMGDKFVRFWREIEVQRLTFDSNTRIAEAVSQLDKASILALYQAAFVEHTLPRLAVTQGGELEQGVPLATVKRDQLKFFLP